MLLRHQIRPAENPLLVPHTLLACKCFRDTSLYNDESGILSRLCHPLHPLAETTLTLSRYYFAIILSTRRFFTLYVMPLVKDFTSEDQASASPDRSEKSTNLAHVCLDAAKNLANVGYNASKSDRSVNNMCLMKYALPHLSYR